MPSEMPAHGTPERYRAGPCADVPGTPEGQRCEACRSAWAAYKRDQRAGKRATRDAAGPLAQAAERGRGDGTAARLEALWAAEAEAQAAEARGWRAELLELAGTGHDCPSGHPRRWAGAHTVLVCLECNERDSSPGAQAREADLGQARAERKARGEGVARRGPTDADVLALERHKGIIIEELEDYADSDRVRPGDKQVIRRIMQWVESAETEARLDELIETMRAEIRPRRFWQADPAALIGVALESAEGEQLGGDERAEGGSFWADYDRNTAAAARVSAVHSAQVRQLRPGVNPTPGAAAARRQGFSACACGGWADPAQRYETYTGAWCRNCGALIRSPLTGKRGGVA